MTTFEFTEYIMDEYTTTLSNDDFEEFHDTFDYYMADVSYSACIESLEYDGFSEADIKQLFEGRYLHDGGMWGMIPHVARLYTNESRTVYILTVGVAG